MLLSFLLACSSPSPIQVDALDQTWIAVDTPVPLQGLSLQDAGGQPVDERWFVGQWTIVALGYTSCPDVCPTTLGSISHALDELEVAGLSPRAVFLAVDPDRDTERLDTFVHSFHSNITGLTGTEDGLNQAASQLGAAFSIREQDGQVHVDHSTSLFVVDPNARLVAYHLRAGDPDAVARDVGALMKASPPPIEWVDGWVRPPRPGVPVTAGYGTLINHSDEPLTLTRVSGYSLTSAHLHETVVKDGVASMRSAGLVLEPGASVALQPGGRHFMLEDVTPPMVHLLLEFAEGPKLWVEGPVESR